MCLITEGEFDLKSRLYTDQYFFDAWRHLYAFYTISPIKQTCKIESIVQVAAQNALRSQVTGSEDMTIY